MHLETDGMACAASGNSSTATLDLGGRTLLPGMIDPHTHMIPVYLDWIDVAPMVCTWSPLPGRLT